MLDDNRELFIPETQTLIKAHPGFMIFATQNPPGLYGGRKVRIYFLFLKMKLEHVYRQTNF